MLTFLPSRVRGVLASVLVIINTLFWCLPLYFFGALRFFGPASAEPWCTRQAMHIAELWVDVNNVLLGLFAKLDLDVQGVEGLSPDKWYLVFSNHQTWADIVILQRVFNRRIPMLKFFIKQQLIYIPFIGIAWWVLDFPIMKRYSREFLAKHPELRGKDLEATRKSCEKFSLTPVSILNFLEGTRFTSEKHERFSSPYKHLLAPKSGGASMVVSSLGDKLDCVLNVTIHYPDGAPGFFDFLCGQLDAVSVHVEQLPVPVEVTKSGDNTRVQKDFREWVAEIWQEKDRKLEHLESSNRTSRVYDSPANTRSIQN